MTQPTSRRGFLQFLTATGATTLLAACGQIAVEAPRQSTPPTSGSSVAVPIGAPTPASVAAAAAADTAQIKRGGTLRWSMLGNPLNLNPHNYGLATNVMHVWDRLILMDENLNWMPRLAQSWDVNNDYTQIKLNMRQGVQFHNGKEFTAADVAWNVERVRDISVGGVFTAYVANIDKVETPDKYTAIVHCPQPYPYISHILQTLNMADSASMGADGLTHPIGTGPFKFVEYAQGDHITLTKNPDYWRKDLPHVDDMDIKIFGDPQAMQAQLEGGALDLAINPTLQDTSRLSDDPRYSVLVDRNAGSTYCLVFNTAVPPGDNKAFRQALRYAVDRQRIASSVLLGFGSPADLPWYATSPAYDQSKDQLYQFDLDMARSLLQQAGLSDVETDLNYSSVDSEAARMGQIIQADLEKIGVKVGLKPTDPPTLLAAETARPVPTYRGMVVYAQPFGHVQPGVMIAAPSFGPIFNIAGYHSDAWTAESSAFASETDPAKQKQTYATYNDDLLDLSLSVFIAKNFPRALTPANVRGVIWNMAIILDGTEAWIS
ncbi:MAG: ABC transporter substrate-binding protein [Chloroflexi bacterium]|nr:ABC transporter substrate-binding protein [Chloroflexota bacterium]